MVRTMTELFPLLIRGDQRERTSIPGRKPREEQEILPPKRGNLKNLRESNNRWKRLLLELVQEANRLPHPLKILPAKRGSSQSRILRFLPYHAQNGLNPCKKRDAMRDVFF